MTTRDLFLRHVAQTSESPLMLEITRAEGVWMYGPQGEKYLDLISGISVSSLGHAHPKIREAVNKQMALFSHLMVYGEYMYQPTVRLAHQLCNILPKNLNSVYFTNSGAEAVEGALKLAKRFTGRTEIISFYNAYHGSTAGALSVMGSEYFKSAYRPLIPGNKLLRYNHWEDINQITESTAAVLIEPIQAEAGIIPPLPHYLEKIQTRCRETGTLLIFDEIQTGMGRTGKMFAFEHTTVVPDILLLAKAFGGGLPMGAFISDHQIMYHLTHHPYLGHITTFGGNAVCAAAAEASLRELMNTPIISEVESKGKIFDQYFAAASTYQYRRVGFLMCIQFPDFETNKKIIDACIAQGVVTDWFLFNSSALRICPPLIISEEEIHFACKIIQHNIQSHYDSSYKK